MIDKRTLHYKTSKIVIRDAFRVILVTAFTVCLLPIARDYLKPSEPFNPLISHSYGVTKVEASEPIVEAPKPKKTNIPANPHQGSVDQYSKQYGVNPELMNCILFKESSYNAGAKNKTSSATGMAQFIKSTWVSFRTRMGEDTNIDLRLDPIESIKTLAWALSKGYKNHWQVVTNGSCK